MESYMATVQSGQERKTQKARREPKVRTDVRVKVKATVTCVVSEVPRINTDEQTATSASQAVFFLLMLCSVPSKPGNRLRTLPCGLAFRKQTGFFLLDPLFNAGNHHEA
jgi:hypothetical protein